MACKEAGLSEEQTAEIRRFFDAEQKKLKRRNDSMERNRISYFSVSNVIEELGENADYEIPDLAVDVEDEVLHKMDLERLEELLEELTEEDREFLQIYFEEEAGAEKRVAERLGITRKKVQCWRERLLTNLRNKFFEKN
ncbi:MAG: hypothetical protein LUC95_02110 [Lachnospiraceae bacterium]|nr:hypothetical protein [Lachnospiraceae bacterium]